MSFAKHSDNTFLSVHFPMNGLSAALLKLSFHFIYLFIFTTLNITVATAVSGRRRVVQEHKCQGKMPRT